MMRGNEIDGTTFEEFFNGLYELNGIERIDLHLAELAIEIGGIKKLELQKFLLIIFSLMDDGNTQFAMDSKVLALKWAVKWNSLIQLAREANDTLTEEDFACSDDFNVLIENGIKEVLSGTLTSTDLFVLEEEGGMKFLYAKKYYNAKRIIEECCENLFEDGTIPSEESIQGCLAEVRKLNAKFDDNREQAMAITRGLEQNLFITGGPGTGKTTVVLYILWNLLKKNPEMLDWNIYLAAPSGKAADRMLESLKNGLAYISEDEKKNFPKIERKLEGLESSTIHRLLKVNPAEASFVYNKDKQFDKNSIFVIDEASMIDIVLFSSLLQAIPYGARVFILGDPYQLPSVQAGAVLGEILTSSKNFVVHLKASKRFKDAPEIGKIASYIKSIADGSADESFGGAEFKDFTEDAVLSGNDAVSYFSMKNPDNDLSALVKNWYLEFTELSSLSERVDPLKNNVSKEEEEVRNRLWNLSLSKRVLSAERKGECGTNKINGLAYRFLKNKWLESLSEDECNRVGQEKYFPGQLLIVTSNMKLYRLYNGDTGIVVFSGNIPYLMLKKAVSSESEEERNSAFVFYPLSLLPQESMENAFAITVHKSQGSEYEHVLLLLPMKLGHPLLNNQIIYTGVTRAKQSVSIIAGKEAFDCGCRTLTVRETGICL